MSMLCIATCRYLNNTGLMWESAEEFGALLIFAEHRYYGESRPYSGGELHSNMQYLTAEQAMADYAELLRELKTELQAEDSAVIGFGGSYGGMLAAWMRMKYPHVLSGCIAASAPIWAFPGEEPPVDAGTFAKIVTRDATPAGGASQACAGHPSVLSSHAASVYIVQCNRSHCCLILHVHCMSGFGAHLPTTQVVAPAEYAQAFTQLCYCWPQL